MVAPGESCLARRRSSGKRLSVKFDELLVTDEDHEELGMFREWAEESSGSQDSEDDLSSQGSFVVQDDMFDTPVEDPDLLSWQFKIALDKRDVAFLGRVLKLEKEKIAAGHIEYEICEFEKARNFALAMLSGEESICKVLDDHCDVLLADKWLSETHPNSRCECVDGHKGSLLVRLVRTGQTAMVKRCLDAGVNPNAVICDGDMRKMYWSTDTPDSKRENVKLEAVFEKGTPLTAAAAVGDLRLLEMLLDAGANPEEHDYVVFAVAARYGNINFLQSLLASDQFDDFNKVGRACVIALKNASITNQNKTIDWLLLRLQQFDDWEIHSRPRNAPGTSKSLPIRKPKRTLSTNGWGSLKNLRPRSASTVKSTRSYSILGGSTASTVSSTTSSASFGTTKPQRKNSKVSNSHQLVSEALSSALDELIKEGKEIGAAQRQSLTLGIETMVDLQRKHLPSFDFDARKLLSFYITATSDENVFLAEDVATRLLGLGLGEYLLGDGENCDLLPGVLPAAQKSLQAEKPGSRFSGMASLPHLATKRPSSRRSSASLESVVSSVITPHTPAPVSQAKGEQLSVPHSSKSLRSRRRPVSANMTKFKAVSVMTSRLMRQMASSAVQIPVNALSYSRSNRSSANLSKVASEKERQSAVLSAAQVGHRAVLAQLLSSCSDEMVQSLVVQAASHHQKETVVFLLDEISSRTRRHLDERMPRHFHRSNATEFSGDILSVTLLAGFAAGDMEIVELALDRGASLTSEQIVIALSDIIRANTKVACKGIPKLMEMAEDTIDFGPEELGQVLDVALENTTITNLRAIKSILSRTSFHFVTIKHLICYVHRSCARSNEESWRIVGEILLENLMKSEDHGRTQKDLHALLLEAETLPQIHVGLLTLLMHACDMDDPAVHGDEGDSDSNPSRWL